MNSLRLSSLKTWTLRWGHSQPIWYIFFSTCILKWSIIIRKKHNKTIISFWYYWITIHENVYVNCWYYWTCKFVMGDQLLGPAPDKITMCSSNSCSYPSDTVIQTTLDIPMKTKANVWSVDSLYHRSHYVSKYSVVRDIIFWAYPSSKNL